MVTKYKKMATIQRQIASNLIFEQLRAQLNRRSIKQQKPGNCSNNLTRIEKLSDYRRKTSRKLNPMSKSPFACGK